MTHTRRILLSAALLALPTLLTAQNEITAYDAYLGQEETIDLPEGMMVSEDSLLGEWQAKNYLFPDTTCENPDYNPEYAPEVYRERLQRLPTVIEMTYNDIVQKFIDRYSGPGRRQVSAMLGAANLYVPMFEEALDFYGLPLELKYLPVIESAMNPKAVSPVGATGLWQFMLATGKHYGLQVNSLVDERRDPVKQTWAAARFLRDLFKIYGDWHLVLAAYNCGPGNVNKAIHRAGGERNYWKIYPYLPHETRGYVPAFIAANYIMNYYCDHNICPMRTKYPLQTDTIMVNRNIDMRQVATLCELDYDVLTALNPQYKTKVIPGASTPAALRLPQESVQKFLAQAANVSDEEANEYIEENKEVALDPRAPAAQADVVERLSEREETNPTRTARATTAKKTTATRATRTSRAARPQAARTTTPASRAARNTRVKATPQQTATKAKTPTRRTSTRTKTTRATTNTTAKSTKTSKAKTAATKTSTAATKTSSKTRKTTAATTKTSTKSAKAKTASTKTSSKSSKAAASTSKTSTKTGKAATATTTKSATTRTKKAATTSTTKKTTRKK